MLSEETRHRLIPPSTHSVDEWEKLFPPRDLPAGAEVTRFGPSPTGYVHVGSILVSVISRSVATNSGGVFLVRIEDTDRERIVDDAVAQLQRALQYFSIDVDEGFGSGAYGPYHQSERADIYDTYTADLLAQDKAYPCFCTREELSTLTERQRAAGVPTGYWGRWAACRDLSEDDVARNLDEGKPYVIRFAAPEFTGRRISYVDRVRGKTEIEDNRNDVVIRKSMGLPTYHMAHAVDDHLMRVTTVIRADEWLSSVPLHLQLFDALGFDRPDYAHIAPLVVQDGKSRRKLSKRKDAEANVDYYAGLGYPPEAVLTYLRGLANGRLQDRYWRDVLAAPIVLEECSSSGQLLDLDKLDQISRDIIADLPRDEVATRIQQWASANDPELAGRLASAHDEVVNALAIEESEPGHVRKDLAKWSDFVEKYGFLVPSLFEPVASPSDERFAPLDPETVAEVADEVARNYRHDLDSQTWFGQVREAAVAKGFAAGAGAYKKNPEQYRGSVREAANVVRVLVTGATRSPDLFESSRILGADEVVRRLRSLRS